MASNTILGHHTYTMYQTKTAKDGDSLFQDYNKYRDETRSIRIRPDKNNVDVTKIEDPFMKCLYSGLSPSKKYKMEYLRKGKGIKWDMRLSKRTPAFIKRADGEDRPSSVKAKISPKILAGVEDYSAAANEDDIDTVEALFNAETQNISSLLGEFSSFAPNRIDFCLNGDVKELNIGCTPEQMMILIKRADTAHFEEHMKYDNVSRRMKTDPYSQYLKSGSVNMNDYWPFLWLCQKYPKSPNIDKARHIIRIEVQCKYSKVYAMVRGIKERNEQPNQNIMRQILSDEVSADIVRYYFHKTIGKGDYYTLEDAVMTVRLCNFRVDKEQRLINALKLVSESRGIPKAKAKLKDNELGAFRHTLWELNNMGVNPVTVPKEWDIQWHRNKSGIRYMPNLLNAYYYSVRNGNTPLTAGMKRHLAKHFCEDNKSRYSYFE